MKFEATAIKLLPSLYFFCFSLALFFAFSLAFIFFAFIVNCNCQLQLLIAILYCQLQLCFLFFFFLLCHRRPKSQTGGAGWQSEGGKVASLFLKTPFFFAFQLFFNQNLFIYALLVCEFGLVSIGFGWELDFFKKSLYI